MASLSWNPSSLPASCHKFIDKNMLAWHRCIFVNELARAGFTTPQPPILALIDHSLWFKNFAGLSNPLIAASSVSSSMNLQMEWSCEGMPRPFVRTPSPTRAAFFSLCDPYASNVHSQALWLSGLYEPVPADLKQLRPIIHPSIFLFSLPLNRNLRHCSRKPVVEVGVGPRFPRQMRMFCTTLVCYRTFVRLESGLNR